MFCPPVKDHAKLTQAGKSLKPFARKVSENRAFKKKHGLSYSGKNNVEPDMKKLSQLEIPSFEEILGLQQQTAKKLLIEHGVLPRIKEKKPAFLCWGCGKVMEKNGRGFRCSSGRDCSVRGRIEDPDFVWTPFAGYKRTNFSIDYKAFLRSAYTLGLRIANDQAIHLTREPDTTTGAQRGRVEQWVVAHRIALAFTEFKNSQELRFKTEVVECDSARFGSSKKKSGQRVHSGRTLVLKGRQSKKWSSQPLPVKISTGKRGMGPETAEEVSPHIQKQVPKSALLAVDGARAWKRAADGRQILTGVNHQKKIFTPASKVDKKDLKPASVRFLQGRSKGPKKVAAAYKQHYRVAGGDNAAEGVFGHISNMLRKTNSKGRNAKAKMRTLLAQSSAALLRRPGFLSVLQAHKEYREALLTGALQVSPNQAYNLKHAKWLHADDGAEDG